VVALAEAAIKESSVSDHGVLRALQKFSDQRSTTQRVRSATTRLQRREVEACKALSAAPRAAAASSLCRSCLLALLLAYSSADTMRIFIKGEQGLPGNLAAEVLPPSLRLTTPRPAQAACGRTLARAVAA